MLRRLFTSSSSRFRLNLAHVELRYSRSSGPGGQHVNTTSTKAELRFPVDDFAVAWLGGPDVAKRLGELHGNRMTKDGVFRVASDRERTRKGNVAACVRLVEQCVEEARVEPKERIETKPPKWANEKRLQLKKQARDRKKSRRGGDFS